MQEALTSSVTISSSSAWIQSWIQARPVASKNSHIPRALDPNPLLMLLFSIAASLPLPGSYPRSPPEATSSLALTSLRPQGAKLHSNMHMRLFALKS